MPGLAHYTAALPRRQCCPVFFFVLRAALAASFWSGNGDRAAPCATTPACIYDSPCQLIHCFIKPKNLQGTYQKPLKPNQPSAENHLTEFLDMKNLCYSISVGSSNLLKMKAFSLPHWTQHKLSSRHIQMHLCPNAVT